MIESANEVYLVADSSKIGINSFASLGALSLMNLLITDSKITKENAEMFKNNDIAYIIAE